MKTAVVYKLGNGTYIIHSHTKTKTGLQVACAPYFNIPGSPDDAVRVIEAIKASLIASNLKIVEHPKDWKAAAKEYFSAIGVRSERNFYKLPNRCVSVAFEKAKITFAPMISAKKPDTGFINKDQEENVSVDHDSTFDTIFQALTLVLDRCE